MKQVKLLDCTLRDGGYINDWNFGHSTMTSIYKRLDDSGVDYIEVGFLDDRREFDINRSIQPNTSCFNEVFKSVTKKHAIPLAMIDFGTCKIENIAPQSESFIEGIRVIFKKEKIDQALPFCQAIKDKGYKLFVQAVSITSYTDIEMINYIQKINQLKPFAFSIVDTYGLLDNRKMAHYFDLFDTNLDPEIQIGYHGHNNFQLAFSNTMKFLALATKRTLVGDATVYGMGKSAGNCPIELLAMYMNQTYDTKYDINQYLEIFDTDLSLIYQKQYWGYRYNFYISAMQNCHPSYVEFLLNKKTLTMTDANAILSSIPDDKKLLYDKSWIEQAYTEYQCITTNDEDDIDQLSTLLAGKDVLLIGPGSSIVKDKENIDNVINNNSLNIIAVNFEPKTYNSDYVFLSNPKRYISFLDEVTKGAKVIISSNVRDYENRANFTLNYISLLTESIGKLDNALLLSIGLLIKFGIKKVYLAGFDGYKIDSPNYYAESYSFEGTSGHKMTTNEAIKNALAILKKDIDIEFITDSLYK